jgi:hypothetical protein
MSTAHLSENTSKLPRPKITTPCAWIRNHPRLGILTPRLLKQEPTRKINHLQSLDAETLQLLPRTQHSQLSDTEPASFTDIDPLSSLIPHQSPDSDSDSDSDTDNTSPILQNNSYGPLADYDSDDADEYPHNYPPSHTTAINAATTNNTAHHPYPSFLPVVSSPISLPVLECQVIRGSQYYVNTLF